MAAPFRYVVSDMDGTLFSPDHRLSDFTRETLKTLVHEHGVTPILATGRHHADVKIIANNLRHYIWGDDDSTADAAAAPSGASRAPMMYLLTSNGAVAHNAVTHELVFQSCVDPELAAKLYRYLPASEAAVNASVYQEDEWICRVDWPEMTKIYKERGFGYVHVPDAPPRPAEPVATSAASSSPPRGVAVGNYDNISKLFFLSFDGARLQSLVPEVEAVARSCGDIPFTLTFSSFMSLDAMAAGVCKVQALRELLEVILPAEEGRDVVAAALSASIAFGDGLNDAEMLVEVGKGCVMENATPQLKKDHPELEVIQSNGEDGVARKLCSVFGLACSA